MPAADPEIVILETLVMMEFVSRNADLVLTVSVARLVLPANVGKSAMAMCPVHKAIYAKEEPVCQDVC